MVTGARSIALLFLSALHGLQDAYGQGNGAVKLYRAGDSSHRYSSGVVQVYYGRSWGSVCASTWTAAEADVVCHQLGWQGAMNYGLAADEGYGTDNAPAVLDDVQCSTAEYLVLLQCTYSTNIGSDCSDGTDATVACYTTRLWDILSYNGALRLTGGQYITEGLVEIYCNGQWGTVCDDAFGPMEAGTVCRQLGYTTALRYDHLIIPGNSSQSIWLDNVVCEQIEGCIATCQSCPPQGQNCLQDREEHDCHDCRHPEDITVECGTDASYGDDIIVTTCENANNPPTEPKLLSLGAIVGVVVGCVILLFITMVIPVTICCCCRGQYHKSESEDMQSGNGTQVVPSATNPTLATTITPLPLVSMENSPTIVRRNQYSNHTHQGSNHTHQGSNHSHQGSLDRAITPKHLPLLHTNSAPYNRHGATPPAYEEPTFL